MKKLIFLNVTLAKSIVFVLLITSVFFVPYFEYCHNSRFELDFPGLETEKNDVSVCLKKPLLLLPYVLIYGVAVPELRLNQFEAFLVVIAVNTVFLFLAFILYLIAHGLSSIKFRR
jgi:hypothetical protein